jgi:hypothetical protein
MNGDAVQDGRPSTDGAAALYSDMSPFPTDSSASQPDLKTGESMQDPEGVPVEGAQGLRFADGCPILARGLDVDHVRTGGRDPQRVYSREPAHIHDPGM